MTNGTPDTPRRWRPVTVLLLSGFALWQGVAWLGALFGGGAWWLDLPNHGPQYSALFAFMAAAVAWGSPSRALAVAFGVAGILHAGRWGFAVPAPVDSGGPGMRVFVANVYSANTDHQALIQAVRTADPDIIGLLEVDRVWLDALQDIRTEWPHSLEHPRTDNFGIALYSRLEVESLREVTLSPTAVPTLRADLGNGTAVVLTHPLPPIGRAYAADRDEQLDRLADLLNTDVPTVVMGDLNCTPWSASFPSRGPVAGGTWPATLPGIMRLPIDHVLTGGGATIRTFELGPRINSDHLPIIADIALPTTP